MRNCIEFKHCINLLKSISMSTVRLKHNWTMYLSENNNILYCGTNHMTLLPPHCGNNILITQRHCPNRLENFKAFSTTTVLAKGKDRGKDKKKGSRPQHIDVREMEKIVNVEKLTMELEKVLDKLKVNFIKNVSLRTAAGAIDELPITFDGSQYILQELVQINRTPKLITLNANAFPQAIPQILETLSKNQMNLNPQQDGTMIYISIPKVTKEYRENLSKSAKSYFIKSRDDIKDIRSKEIKKLKNIEKLPQDVCFRVQGYIEILADQYIVKAEKILETKQNELMVN